MQRFPGAIFQQINARPHTARVSQDCLRNVTTLPTLPWPTRSPDLSSIEHIWGDLGERVEHTTSLIELEAKVQQIRNEMSQDVHTELVLKERKSKPKTSSEISKYMFFVKQVLHFSIQMYSELGTKTCFLKTNDTVFGYRFVKSNKELQFRKHTDLSATILLDEIRFVFCSPNCFNGIIVYYSTYYSLFHTTRGVSSTVSRRLAEAGLHSQWPLGRLPLIPQHWRNHLEWCRSQSSWLSSDRHCIVFSSESRFTLEEHGHRLRDWRGRSERSQSTFILQRHTATTLGVTKYRSISYDVRLVIRGPVTNKTISGSIQLAYLRTALVPLILFHGQKDHLTFYQSNMRVHGRTTDSGTPKYRRSGERNGECLAESIS
ncbi:transposable element Tcb2 transposase [Trichonephila clavipes]|nr:transposable element Tcb2 transposase [Trichonephila clavipes]